MTAANDDAAGRDQPFSTGRSGVHTIHVRLDRGAESGSHTARRHCSDSAIAAHLFGLTPSDRVLQFASLNWDTCLEEILPALTSGASLLINDEAYTGSFPRFLRMLAADRVTVLDLPSAYWHELVHYLWRKARPFPTASALSLSGERRSAQPG